MNKKEELIAKYYHNAREFVRLKKPKAARAYVVAILNEALATYHTQISIVEKAKMEVFMQKWIAVSKDLYDKGITDYVLECFNLKVNKAIEKPTEQIEKKQIPKNNVPDIDISALMPIEKAPTSKNSNDLIIKNPDKNDINLTPNQNNSSDVFAFETIANNQGWGAAIFEKYKYAVVRLSVNIGQNLSTGTGFIISKNGYLLTNDHVVFDEGNGIYASKIAMSFADSKKKFKIQVLFSDKKSDIALCQFQAEDVKKEIPDFTAVKFIDDFSKVIQGADCLIIGNGFDIGLSPFMGNIRFTKNEKGDIVHTAPSNHGDSGGPLFNRNGEVIGINKSRTVAVNGLAAEGYANATSVDKINELLSKWKSNNNLDI